MVLGGVRGEHDLDGTWTWTFTGNDGSFTILYIFCCRRPIRGGCFSLHMEGVSRVLNASVCFYLPLLPRNPKLDVGEGVSGGFADYLTIPTFCPLLPTPC